MKKFSLFSDRMADLMNKAANALADLSDPFQTWWLSENEVTLGECAALFESIARLIQWFGKQPTHVQAKIMLYDLGGDLGMLIAQQIHKDNTLATLQECADRKAAVQDNNSMDLSGWNAADDEA